MNSQSDFTKRTVNKKLAILASYDKLPKMGQCNAAMLCTIIKSQVQIVKDA
jgi:hypothetical protein